MNKQIPKVAAFDFDGTISYRDSLLPFLFFTHGRFLPFFKLLKCLPTLLAYLIRLSTRQKTKEAILTEFYGGLTLEEMNALGERYATTVLSHRLRPEALERIKWHREQGDRLILVSASIETYLKPWAKSVGFQEVLASKLEVDNQNRVTGKLLGLNCRAEEKVRRLNHLLGPRNTYFLYAYGDSAGDKEMLAFADYPFLKKMS